MKLLTPPVVEGIKQVARVIFLAAVTALAGWIAQKVSSLDPGSAEYIVGTLVLLFIDKVVHVSDKTKLNGISPV